MAGKWTACMLAAGPVDAAGGGAGPGAARAGRLFVAPNGHDTWSGTLPAPNASGTDGPFRTPAAAIAAMRQPGAKRIAYLRGGDYALASSLILGPADAGDRIAAYPGAQPVLFGGVRVAAWRAAKDDEVVAAASAVASGSELPQLMLNGRRLRWGRIPADPHGPAIASAWFFADRARTGLDPHRTFRVRAVDAALFNVIRPGTLVTIFGQRGWQDYVMPILSADASTRVITLDGTTWDALGEGSRFALLNVPGALGTWWFDRKANVFRLRSPEPTSPVVVATLPCVVSLKDTQDVVLEQLHLVGSAAEGAGVCLSHTKRVILRGLEIAHTGDGIRLNEAQDTRIEADEIADTASFGIVLRHSSNRTTVEQNWLHQIGWLHEDASAIWFDASSHSRFVHNRIEDVAKFGIGGGALTDGAAYDNLIEENEIDRANQRTSDGGGILVIDWTQDATHDVIAGNLVSRTGALGNVGWDGTPHITFQNPTTRLVSYAIYLDDWASGVTVRDNLVCRDIGGIDLHAGWDNVVTGNVVIGNAGIALSVDAREWLGTGAHPHAMTGNVIDRNTVVLNTPGTGQSGAVVLNAPFSAAAFNNNVYLGPGLNNAAFHETKPDAWSAYSFGFDTWQSRGEGVGSRSDPTARLALLNGELRRLSATDDVGVLKLPALGRNADQATLLTRVRARCGLS